MQRFLIGLAIAGLGTVVGPQEIFAQVCDYNRGPGYYYRDCPVNGYYGHGRPVPDCPFDARFDCPYRYIPGPVFPVGNPVCPSGVCPFDRYPVQPGGPVLPRQPIYPNGAVPLPPGAIAPPQNNVPPQQPFNPNPGGNLLPQGNAPTPQVNPGAVPPPPGQVPHSKEVSPRNP